MFGQLVFLSMHDQKEIFLGLVGFVVNLTTKSMNMYISSCFVYYGMPFISTLNPSSMIIDLKFSFHDGNEMVT